MGKIFFIWILQFVALTFTRPNIRIITLYNIIFSAYLCLFAPLFWIDSGLLFAGLIIDPPSFISSVLPLTVSFTMYSIILAVTSKTYPISALYKLGTVYNSHPYISNAKCLIILSLELTLIVTSSFLGISSTLSKFIYQIIDGTIFLTFYLLCAGRLRFAFLSAFLFILYSLYTGFRYKLLFLFLACAPVFLPPLTLSNIILIFRRNLLKTISLISFGYFSLQFLSAMTLTRQKFSEVSLFQNLLAALDVIITQNSNQILGYAFYADSNILFANFMIWYSQQSSMSITFQRITSSIQSYILVLLPNNARFGSDYLSLNTDILALFGTRVGIDSSTAHPFFSYLTYIYAFPGSLFIFIFSTIILFIVLAKCSIIAVNKSFALAIYLPNGYVANLSSLIYLALLGPSSYLFFFRGFGPESFKFVFILCSSAIILGRLLLDRRH